jgi:hypothetical protein
LDFEKAYDRENWDFLLKCLQLRGFRDRWKVVSGGTINVKLNDQTGPYFISRKGVVRQDEPLSPILFDFVADCLTKMVKKAHMNKLTILFQMGWSSSNMQVTPSYVSEK